MFSTLLTSASKNGREMCEASRTDVSPTLISITLVTTVYDARGHCPIPTLHDANPPTSTTLLLVEEAVDKGWRWPRSLFGRQIEAEPRSPVP